MKIRTLNEYKSIIARIRSKLPFPMSALQLLFRGHSKNAYQLLPTLCRHGFNEGKVLLFEKYLHNEFKSRIKDGSIGSTQLHIPNSNDYLDDWTLLFQERHLELPTRVLDWTTNEMVALYFALNNENHHGVDGHVWVLTSINSFSVFSEMNPELERIKKDYQHLNAGDKDIQLLSTIDPFSPDKIYLLHNSFKLDGWKNQIGEKRRFFQNGKFTVTPNDRISTLLENNIIGNSFMRKIEIDGASKNDILEELTSEHDFSDKITLPPIPKDTQEIIEEIIETAKEKVNSDIVKDN